MGFQLQTREIPDQIPVYVHLFINHFSWTQDLVTATRIIYHAFEGFSDYKRTQIVDENGPDLMRGWKFLVHVSQTRSCMTGRAGTCVISNGLQNGLTSASHRMFIKVGATGVLKTQLRRRGAWKAQTWFTKQDLPNVIELWILNSSLQIQNYWIHFFNYFHQTFCRKSLLKLQVHSTLNWVAWAQLTIHQSTILSTIHQE